MRGWGRLFQEAKEEGGYMFRGEIHIEEQAEKFLC
jgi:hypothetical protein